MPHTSFEAVDGSRDLYPASQEVGESREGQGEEDAESGCGREEKCLGMVIVDFCECVHGLARFAVDFMIRTWSGRMLKSLLCDNTSPSRDTLR